MTISENILNDIELQPLSQKVGVLKKMFNELTYSHLPVERDGVYLGCISENDLRCFEEDKTLQDYQYALSPFFVRDTHALLDIIKVFSNNDANLLPVLSEKNHSYLGYLELIDIMGILDDSPFISEEGNILIVEKGRHDYSFSEISQIIESNDGQIYGTYINHISNDMVQVTIKMNLSGMNEILQTFRRYGYRVISNHQEDRFLQNLKERSDYLNKYLNI